MSNLTRRIDLNLGYTCNINCRFCYYQNSMHDGTSAGRKDLSTQDAKRWLLFFRRKGLDAVDLTGGEPTIRRDIVELIAYARAIGYSTVCVITNGLRLADRAFTEQMVKAGLNDILFSIHGPDAKVHDGLTRVPGSFDKLMRAIDLVREHAIILRSNTVVSGMSAPYLEQIARLLQYKGFDRVNFILFNPIVEAQSSDAKMNVNYRDASGYLKGVIDKYKHVFKRITVRYIPFVLWLGMNRMLQILRKYNMTLTNGIIIGGLTSAMAGLFGTAQFFWGYCCIHTNAGTLAWTGIILSTRH